MGLTFLFDAFVDGPLGGQWHPPDTHRCICSIYTLNQLARPDMHKVVCIMLATGPMSNNQLRGFIARHIVTGHVPQWSQEHVWMRTFNFAHRHGAGADASGSVSGSLCSHILCNEFQSFSAEKFPVLSLALPTKHALPYTFLAQAACDKHFGIVLAL